MPRDAPSSPTTTTNTKPTSSTKPTNTTTTPRTTIDTATTRRRTRSITRRQSTKDLPLELSRRTLSSRNRLTPRLLIRIRGRFRSIKTIRSKKIIRYRILQIGPPRPWLINLEIRNKRT